MSGGHQPERVIEALLQLLAEEPELRVGQAIAQATHRVSGQFDPFGIEDGQLARALERLAEESRRRKAGR
jgi:hypothetical protein